LELFGAYFHVPAVHCSDLRLRLRILMMIEFEQWFEELREADEPLGDDELNWIE
jgi:hypothetical protein